MIGHLVDMRPAAKFLQELRDWRKTRPEHKELLAAVRKGRPDDELIVLARAAGLPTITELLDLVRLRERALRLKSSADELAKRKKEVERIDAEWLALDKQLSQAKTRAEEDELDQKMFLLCEPRQTAHQALAAAQSAHNCVTQAKAEGVL